MEATWLSLTRASLLALLLAGCGTLATNNSSTSTSALPGGGTCDGKNPAAAAVAWQGTAPYVGKDKYANLVVDKGTLFYALYPSGKPGFVASAATVRAAGGDVAAYYRLVQVSTDPGVDAAGRPRQLRTQVRTYEVTAPLCVAIGLALANPQFGQGGGTQLYVVDADADKLQPGEVAPIARWTPAADQPR